MIALNATAQVISLGGMLLVQTGYVILVARILGVEDFGRFSLVFSITQILLTGGDLGLHNTAIRKISFRPRQSTEIFPLFVALKLVVSAGLTGVVAILAIFLPESPETRIALFVFGLGLFFHSLVLGLNVGFQAHGKLYLASLNSLLLLVFQAAIGLAGLFFGGRVIWLGFAYLSASVLALCLNWVIFERTIHPVRIGALTGWKTLAKESFPVGLGALFDATAARIAISLLSVLAGSYATGIFSAAARITNSLRNLPVAVFSAVLPALAQHSDRPWHVKLLFRRYLSFLLLATLPVAITLSLTSDRLILLIYDTKYAEAAGVLRILALSLIPACFGIALSSVMTTQNTLFRKIPWVAAGAMLVNLAVNWVLIPRYGSRGAALGQLATESASALFYGVALWSFFRSARERNQRGASNAG